MFRKVLLRRRLLRWAAEGAAYVPFIGDGDIASELYLDRQVYGADLDPDRVEAASSRLDGQIVVADCDQWPFYGVDDRIAVADFDAYAYPYHSFRAFWENAQKAERVAMFFTDGERQTLMRMRGRGYIAPDGDTTLIRDEGRRRRIFNFYLSRHVWPWFESEIAPWRVITYFRYLRGWMAYWGCVVTGPE